MLLALSLPRVEAVDLRMSVPPEHALVISSEHTSNAGSPQRNDQANNVAWPPPANSPAHLMKPSFLTMEFLAQPRFAKQKVRALVLIHTRTTACLLGCRCNDTILWASHTGVSQSAMVLSLHIYGVCMNLSVAALLAVLLATLLVALLA